MNQKHDESKSDGKKSNFLTRLTSNCSAPLTQVALMATSSWLIVTGLKGVAGFPVNQATAAADLVGILIVIGAARWFKARSGTK